MTRFTNQQLTEAYSLPYILPRRVTMVVDFQTNESKDLLPTYEVRVVPNQNYYVFHHVKWIEVLAFNNKQPVGRGWIPKSVLHDFAYSALINKGTTGVSFGGDKIDYDSGIQATDRTMALPNVPNVRSRCSDCGATLTSHKVYEDADLAEKMDALFAMLTTFEGSIKTAHGTAWKPKASGNQSLMMGMARTAEGRYILAYSGNDHSGRAALEGVLDRFAKKVGGKGKWSLANSIPTTTTHLTRRNRALPQITANDVNAVFTTTGVQLVASLQELSCAAPKLIHHAFDIMNAASLLAMTEAWYEPANAKSFQNSTGRTLRRHGQKVPSCTRCSTVVRLLLCP